MAQVYAVDDSSALAPPGGMMMAPQSGMMMPQGMVAPTYWVPDGAQV